MKSNSSFMRSVTSQCGNSVSTYIYQHPYALDLSFSRIKYPGYALLRRVHWRLYLPKRPGRTPSFNRHMNRGEKDTALVKDHHEPIISREDWENVQRLIQQRSQEKSIEKDNRKYLKRYTFTGRILRMLRGARLNGVSPTPLLEVL